MKVTETTRELVQRKEELKAERLAQLLSLGFNIETRIDLGEMDQAMFNSLKLGVEAAKREKEDAEAGKIAKIKAEAAENERIRKENERLQKEAAEAEAAAEAERKRQSELNKGDEDKVKDLISDITALKSKYTFKSKYNKRMYNDFGYLVDKIINRIKK